MTEVKEFYMQYADTIHEKRAHSPYPLRRYVHVSQYGSALAYVEPGMRVLDAGCGEGNLSILMAKKGARVVGIDISEPNIEASKSYANEEGCNVEFLLGDLENLPFADDSFDLVVSSHVLEHLSDFDKGLREMARVSKRRIVAAIPTVLSPCSWVQVGRGWFYLPGPRSFLAFGWGFLRMCGALVLGREGVNETYGGADVPHIFRFPWIMKRKVRANGLSLISYEADSLCIPYFPLFLPLIRWANARRGRIPLRYCGYGTLYVIEKPTSS